MKRRRLVLLAVSLVSAVSCGKIGIDKRDEHGMTALMHAAQRGDRAEVERLIARGANVNATVPTRDVREMIAFLSWMQQLPKSDIGYRPLHYAAQSGHADVARVLIQKGADVTHIDRGGMTALDLAITKSDLAIMKLLTGAGARADAKRFWLAVAMSSPQTVQFLLQHGANPNVLPPSDPQSPSPYAAPLVIVAARRGDPAVLKLLIDAGVDVNARDQNGWSALRHVRDAERRRAGRDVSEIVALLEVAGARDEAGARAAVLFDAVAKKDVAGVRQALSAGTNANARDDRGVPVLVYAAHRGESEIVAALIDAGANVNTRPANDATPLIAAIEGGSVDAVRKLLSAGARVDQADHLRRTPLQVASGRKQTEITSLLLSSNAKVDSGALSIAALNGNVDQVRMLLASGANPNSARGHALREAARGCYRRENTEIIRALLDAGADPKLGESGALSGAAALCSAEVVSLLLQRGANPNVKDMNGYTPLISAASSGKLENARLLIAAGADVNARDIDGKSVLSYAARFPEIQQELRRAGAR